MTPLPSAGILLYRYNNQNLEVLLVHPGGPYWQNKEFACWSIPKGEYDDSEEPYLCAIREFQEELGAALREDTKSVYLGQNKNKSGKLIQVWAMEGDFEPDELISNTCEIEWPPKTGQIIEIPEVDRAEWFTPIQAEERLFSTQLCFIDRLLENLGEKSNSVRAPW